MSDENIRIVEINGVKVEVDLRTAKRVDQFKIGDPCKVLVKDYSGYKAHHGVIVSFDEFENLPTITVCYLDGGYSPGLKFAYINSKTEDTEIAPANDEILVEKADIVEQLDSDIIKKQAELDDLKRKKAYFLNRFGAVWGEEE